MTSRLGDTKATTSRRLGWAGALLLMSIMAAAGAEEEPLLPVAASSVFDSRYLPEYAVDGNPGTRWASPPGGGREWLQVDLGAAMPIERLSLRWERAFALEYEVQVSDDGSAWQTVRKATGKAGLTEFTGLGARGRYLRILCLKPEDFPLYSIWDITSPDEALERALKAAGEKVPALRAEADRKAQAGLAEALHDTGTRDIIFAVRAPGVDGHWYANFGYYAADTNAKLYQPKGGQLCRLDSQTGKVTVLLNDPTGCVRDPQVHYDAQKIVFSYLKGGTTHYHLFEIGVDGTGLRQLTDGDCDDIEPTYLPDGGIAFCSSRCNRWVNCWLTPVAVLYRCDGDGLNVRMLSSNVEQDNTPWVMPDGRLLHTRWEYIDRSQVDYHHLWTMNPDGTGQMVYFGNMFPGTAILDAKPIPGADKILAIWSPGHGLQEHQGQVAVVDHGEGPDARERAHVVPSDQNLRDPWPLDQRRFIAARGGELIIMDTEGRAQVFFRLAPELSGAGLWVHEPRLLTPRPREPVIPSRVDYTQTTGRLLLADVRQGRNMAGVAPGEVRKLLVLEALPKPINYTGGMDPLSYGGTFTLERVLGTVPVEPDGSAYFEVPPLRSLFFVALDKDNLSVKRMQSFVTVQPGETTGCVGCHDQRTNTLPRGLKPAASQRAPSPIAKLAGMPAVFDFPRDIQPVLDRNCVSCHDYQPHTDTAGQSMGPRAGGVILTGDRGPVFSHSYCTLTIRKQFVDGRDQPRGNLPPRAIGTSASPLMRKITDHHHGVALTTRETDLVRYWIESGAAYPGTYGALGGGAIGGYYANGLTETGESWPETRAASDAIQRRCASCHTGNRVLPRTLADERDVSFWRPEWDDPRLPLGRHLVFNLSRPDQSLMLLAPLAKTAGGYGSCQEKTADGSMRAVFTDASDADYRAILSLCQAGKRRLDEIKRFDMPGFRPPEPYLREMARYGVLQAIPPAGQAVDAYLLDEKYWEMGR